METSNRKTEKLSIAAISIGFVAWSAAFIYRSSFIAIDGRRYFCLFDDAMISMRYAWNLSHGFGLVWNQGEHIQGYTNLLMTLLMSFATLVFDKSVAALSIQILGVGFMLAIAYVSMRITDYVATNATHQRQALIRVLVFFCTLSYYPLAYWSLMGMETGLLTLLLLLGVLSALRYTSRKKPVDLFLVAGFLGLAFLTRSDSLVLAAPVWMYVAWETVTSTARSNRKVFGQVGAAFGLYFLFVLGQFLFQYLYYEELVPNTYTLKLAGMPLTARLADGVGFIRPFLKVSAFILILSSIELVFDFSRRKLLLLSVVLLAIGYQVYVGGDPWSYWRMMSPSMPLLTVLFVISVNAIVAVSLSTQAFVGYCLRNPVFPRRWIGGLLLVALTLMGLVLANARFLPEIAMLTKPYTADANQLNVDTALAFGEVTTGDATVGVFWAGAIPYYLDRKAIDFLGKSDRYIAQLPPDVSGSIGWGGMRSVPGHNKYDLSYSIKTLEPTYVQGFQWGTQDLAQWAETKYVTVEYGGVSLALLRESPAVLWDKVSAP